MSEMQMARNERNRKIDILKNKKLVKILNHKMFKGYRDIKASKWFSNQKPKFISQINWEDKIFDPFDDLYNLNYKMNVLYPLKNPPIDNLLFIKNYPPKEKTVMTHNTKNISRPKTTITSFTSSNKNLTTIGSQYKSKSNKNLNKKNNFYLTSMSIYQTNNFYYEPNPQKIYKEIFENDKVIYNDIPILSLDKVRNYNTTINLSKKKKNKNSKNKSKNFVQSSRNEIIQTNNIYDEYNGLTEKQFLYKISHNKSNKSIDEKIKVNAFRRNKGFVRGYVNKRFHSARPMPNLGLPSLNKKSNGPEGVTIELEYDEIGNMKAKKIIATHQNYREDILSGNNNYLVYNREKNIENRSNMESRSKSGYKETEIGNNIFGNSFKDLKNKSQPPLKYFETKPRFFDDKLLLQFQLDKKNKFLRLKQKME